jgi:hypothetical protein
MTTTSGAGSSKRRLEILSLAMALTVAVTGALPLLWLVTRSDTVSQPSDQAPSEEPSVTVRQPVVDAAGLSPSIVRVLESSGFATATGRTQLEGRLAPAVLDVLIADGVVLTVPDGADPGRDGGGLN